MTEHPGEQFPPGVDPDVEPGFDPYPSEDTPEAPDYDAEPAPQNFSYGDVQPEMGQYGEDGEQDTEAAFEASVDAPANREDEPAPHVDPAEVEFGPEFARAPEDEHQHPFVADSAAEPEDDSPEDDDAHPLVEETMSRLDELRDRPVAEHADVYADLHERLQTALVEADAETGDRS
ncbi:hypothetical protein ACIBL3_31990 [Kribbella sp. NPDC050124]|uniref:hypothetical protein n=1 Tax=Kribbella sp. NPDC050124 TaxID=3364114 RepID=UPI0037992B29